jgi:hypothetical protein
MLKPVMRSLICITLIFAVASGARAGDDVQVIVDPDESIAGRTQLFWAKTWWQWVLSIPDTPNAPNPNNDQTGASAAIGNTGPVFFLAGTFGGPAVTRTITVPSGKPVFFPIANVFFAAVGATGNFDPAPCSTPLTLSCALGLIRGPICNATNMTVTIDNNTITTPKIKNFRQTSTSFFTVTLPPSNVFGLPPKMYFPNNPVWVQDGYYIMLNNLSLGTHTLHFHGEIPPIPILGLPKFTGDVTDTLNVVVAP